MAYESAFSGPQIDEAVRKVISGEAVGPVGPPGPAGADGADGAPGPTGANGATFRPFVSEAGVLSWTNDKGLSNPEPVNIKGPPGESGSGGTAGVSSFNGRTGVVMPQKGDYSAADVGARPDDWMPTAADVGARPSSWMPSAADVGAVPVGVISGFSVLTKTEYDALATKSRTVLYLIKE